MMISEEGDMCEKQGDTRETLTHTSTLFFLPQSFTLSTPQTDEDAVRLR